MKQFRFRKDKYHGWRFYVDGCPNPLRKSLMQYWSARDRRWDRRTAAAVAGWVVFGSMRAFRYASAQGYLPSERKPIPAAQTTPNQKADPDA